jgi:hypothetical protein
MITAMSHPFSRSLTRVLACALASSTLLVSMAAPALAMGASSSPTATVPTAPAGGAVAPTAARTPAQARPHRAGKVSTAAIVIAAIAAVLALGCAAWAIARLQAFEPHWSLSARHLLAEAGFRASSTWAEFSDWIRVGH